MGAHDATRADRSPCGRRRGLRAAALWKTYRDNYLTDHEIARSAAAGFNSVRPAMSARRLLPERQDAFDETRFACLPNVATGGAKGAIPNYVEKGGNPPTANVTTTLADFVTNMQWNNCSFHQDVIRSITPVLSRRPACAGD